MKKRLFFFIFLVNSFFLWSESEGEKLFMQNKPAEASLVLESEIASGKASGSAWNWLGLCYYQLGDFKKAVEVFQKGLSVSGTNKKILAYNAGNACYAMQDYEKARDYYSLAYKSDKTYFAAVLNKANSNLMAKDYDKAIEDYELFLQLAPEDPQNPKIRELLALLRKEMIRIEEENRIAAEEAARIAEEERLFEEELKRIAEEKAEAERIAREAEEKRIAEQKAEEERIAREKREEEERIAREKKAEEERIAREKKAEEERLAEEKRLADAERRRKLLEEVASSLQETDSTSMSSGAEDIIDYDQESELD